MKPEQLKIIEVHEIMDAHEWKHVSKSFEVCKCGMCRGSSTMFHAKQTAKSRRRNGTFVADDWINLSKVESERNWFKFKMKHVDRIQEYLVQFPFWAGYYGKKTGNAELIEVMKQDPTLLLQYSLEHKEFDEEVEEKLRGNVSRLFSFLDAKYRYLDNSGNKNDFEIMEESRTFLLLNSSPQELLHLAKLDGPADDIKTILCEKGDSEQLNEYSGLYAKAASEDITKRLIELLQLQNYYSIPSLIEYASNFGLLQNPEIKSALYKYPEGIKSWILEMKENKELLPSMVLEAKDLLISIRGKGQISRLISKDILELNAELLAFLIKEDTYLGDLDLPVDFDRPMWEVLINNNTPESVQFLKKWKQQLRIRWTNLQADQDAKAAEFERQGKFVEAKVWRKQRAATSKWAHNLLTEYKKIVKKDN